MAVRYQILQDDPLASKLLELIPVKANELGWFTEDSSLSEYVVMKFLSPKSQEEIAEELKVELLQPEDKGAPEFSQWLFEIIASYRNDGSGNAGQVPAEEHVEMGDDGDGAMATGDMEMDGDSSGAIPTGPKSMRNGNRGRRNMLGQISKQMDRSQGSVLHKVRNTKGTERINSHSREPPTGPRHTQNRTNGRQTNSRPMGAQQMPMGPGMMANPNMTISPQQQMQMLQLYEQQARMMAEILQPGQQGFNPALAPQMMNGAFVNGMHPQQGQGRSLFDRVEKPQRFNNNKRPQKGISQQQDHDMTSDAHQVDMADAEPSSSMEVESSQPANGEPQQQTCRFNLSCTNKDCKYAHQSPAAPPGVPIDINDKCTFGAACKNKKCVANHPSPAQKVTHQADQECRFFPFCTNPSCPFKHPEMPLCRNGADCTREGCKFTHLKTKCKYSPCMNRACPYKHEEGQRGKFPDKVWMNPAAAAGEGEGGAEAAGRHLSERRFVDEMEGEEELILPGGSNGAQGEQLQQQQQVLSESDPASSSAEVIT